MGNQVSWQHEGTFYRHSIQVRRVRGVHRLNHDDHHDGVARVSLSQVLEALFHNQYPVFEISMCWLTLSIYDKSRKICCLVLFQ